MELDQIKTWLRIDFDDDDELLTSLHHSAVSIIESALRTDSLEGIENADSAVLYVISTLYEKREEADMHEMTLNIRALLFTDRKAAF